MERNNEHRRGKCGSQKKSSMSIRPCARSYLEGKHALHGRWQASEVPRAARRLELSLSIDITQQRKNTLKREL